MRATRRKGANKIKIETDDVVLNHCLLIKKYIKSNLSESAFAQQNNMLRQDFRKIRIRIIHYSLNDERLYEKHMQLFLHYQNGVKEGRLEFVEKHGFNDAVLCEAKAHYFTLNQIHRIIKERSIQGLGFIPDIPVLIPGYFDDKSANKEPIIETTMNETQENISEPKPTFKKIMPSAQAIEEEQDEPIVGATETAKVEPEVVIIPQVTLPKNNIELSIDGAVKVIVSPEVQVEKLIKIINFLKEL